MKLTDKHTRIAILMVISQLLLAGFAIYWLNGQFREEKKSLYDRLSQYYKEAQQVVIDSMLVKNIINPALGDSIFRSGEVKIRGASKVISSDSLSVNHGSRSVQSVSESRDALVTIMIKQEGDTITGQGGPEYESLDNQMLLRSVRLIINNADDGLSPHIGAFYGSDECPDSALLFNDFEARIRDAGLNFNPVWITSAGDSSTTAAGNRVIEVGGWDDFMPGLYISSYRPYLFRQILPQILFALVLVLLTGSASFVAYKSMRKQMILNEMRNSFISNISHELKTPVSTVKVALEAVRNFDLKLDPAVAAEYLEMASKELKRLELLITKVLDNSIIEQDSSILKFEKVDLVRLVKSAIDSLKPRIDEAMAIVRFNHPDQIVIDADSLYLQGVLINLLDNSLKYGNGNPEIDVEIKPENGSVVIVVSDNGPGIPEEYISRVFEKFFRLPGNDTHNVKGYGLGLSFASLIVGMHNGTIKVQNKTRGCSFIIKLPNSRS